jgi:hypothetical protein
MKGWSSWVVNQLGQADMLSIEVADILKRLGILKGEFAEAGSSDD